MTDQQRPYTTTDAGIPATSDEYSLTVGPAGPIVLQDHYVIQKMQHFNRERVPERVVHAKGGGAFGFFQTTEDVSQFTRASLFQKGRPNRDGRALLDRRAGTWITRHGPRPRGFA